MSVYVFLLLLEVDTAFLFDYTGKVFALTVKLYYSEHIDIQIEKKTIILIKRDLHEKNEE